VHGNGVTDIHLYAQGKQHFGSGRIDEVVAVNRDLNAQYGILLRFYGVRFKEDDDPAKAAHCQRQRRLVYEVRPPSGARMSASQASP
jgi:hypothetical protein